MQASTESSGTLEVALAHAARLLAESPPLAERQAREIIAAVGAHPAAEHILARALAGQGQWQEAEGHLRALHGRYPQILQIQFDHAQALMALGQHGDAATQLRKMAATRTPPAAMWLMLADALAAQGDPGAAAAYLEHVRHSGKEPALLQAADALARDEIPTAEALLRGRLKEAPTDVAAIRMLAEVAARLGEYGDAEALLRRCLELAPGFQEARQNLVQVLHRANQTEATMVEVERLMADDPRSPANRNLKAVMLSRLGDYPEAIALYRDIVAEFPTQTKIWLSYGHALKTAGQQSEAVEAYRRSATLQPTFGEAWWSLANLKTFRFEAADLAEIDARLADASLGDEDRLHFEFAAGKAREDAREYEASFGHYARGNALRKRMIPYDAGEVSTRVELAKRVFTREFFREREGWGAPDPDPVFIVGLPRSGSTLIEQILSSHSQVEGTMELPEVLALTHQLRKRSDPDGQTPYHALLASLDRDGVAELGHQYLERTRVQRKDGAPFFIDKMPNNWLHVGLIHLMLPNARIIDARRHPLACGFSGFKQQFARGQSFTYSLDDVGRYYRDYVELMAHFDDVLPGRVHRVFYEDMVDDTEAQVRALLAYCGLPFEEGCLRFFENRRAVRTASSEQVRQPIYRDGVDHWRHYEPWLGPLKAALGDVLSMYPDVPAFSGGSSIAHQGKTA
ncbi:tetratricopeptide repeat-containing sulfotransferase family protein [Solilutibacter silvestris]|uniref:tetratricopeptide repeat-containing sulfotransferase family protein n=1 Tax=Solilutibacter silvestris TaxID=1645665 RepID=UPI003D326278